MSDNPRQLARDLSRRYSGTFMLHENRVVYVSFIDYGVNGVGDYEPRAGFQKVNLKKETIEDRTSIGFWSEGFSDLRPDPGFINNNNYVVKHISYSPSRQWLRSVSAASGMLRAMYGTTFTSRCPVQTLDVIRLIKGEYLSLAEAYKQVHPRVRLGKTVARAFDREFALITSGSSRNIYLYYNRMRIGTMLNGVTVTPSLKLRKNVRRKLKALGVTIAEGDNQ
jgi:hypothetical protein